MIRAITLGLPYSAISDGHSESRLHHFRTLVIDKLQSRRWPLRTLRLTLPPLNDRDEDEIYTLPARINSINALAERLDIRWFCLPLDLTHGDNYRGRLDAAFALLFRQPRMFLNLMVADEQGINIRASHDVARFMLQVAHRSNNGFDNFRLGASLRCPPNAPFFPFSRHEGETLKFSFALETTDIALELSEQVREGNMLLADFADQFILRLCARLREIDAFGHELASDSGLEYAGLDGSLAPFPDGSISVGRLVENLGARPGGVQGSLFITSILTNAIKSAVAISGARATGFNGVMFSVLEDDALASTNNRRALSIDTLNAWSTVCGCGLDMLPVPGSTLPEDIAAIILDTAALAVRLTKPLGVRLLPIPGGEVNEFTRFNYDFLCNSRIMNVAKSDVDFSADNERWTYR